VQKGRRGGKVHSKGTLADSGVTQLEDFYEGERGDQREKGHEGVTKRGGVGGNRGA